MLCSQDEKVMGWVNYYASGPLNETVDGARIIKVGSRIEEVVEAGAFRP